MWRLWLLVGQTIGFVAVAVPLWWQAVQPDPRLGFPQLLAIALVVSGVLHLIALEAFFYPEANRAGIAAYARSVGGWRYLRGGFLFGTGGVGAGALVAWALGDSFRSYGWLALLCLVVALVLAISWASWVPDRSGQEAERGAAPDPQVGFLEFVAHRAGRAGELGSFGPEKAKRKSSLHPQAKTGGGRERNLSGSLRV
jgi:hypothetical protein